jgi:hypothetical protein
MAFFEGLVVTDDGAPVGVATVGGESSYVIDDDGFRRHVPAEYVDRQVLGFFLETLRQHESEASVVMLQMLGQDDIFTKGMVDSTLRNINVEQVLAQRLPVEGRQMLGMMGFRVVIDRHGELVRVEMPAAPEADDAED